jgi:hypothetical protein
LQAVTGIAVAAAHTGLGLPMVGKATNPPEGTMAKTDIHTRSREGRFPANTARLLLVCAAAVAMHPAVMAKHAERDGIGLLPLSDIAKLGGKQKGPQGGKPPTTPSSTGTTALATTAATTTTTPVSVDPRRSLIVTDQTVLASAVPILNVLNALAAGSPQSMTAKQLYDQWMDLNNVAPGIGQGGHCNDEITNGVATLNSFQFDCPRAEGQLVGTNPTNGTPNSYQPIAVVNRFDLATDPRKGGTDCGEYRIIYGKTSGMTVTTNRVLLIFEGVLPNPAPNGTDLSGCRPVAQFWADLSSVTDTTTRINQIKTFFFTGLPGFEPVVKASHYGFATPNAPGQIRANLFMQFNWVLREYHLAIVNNLLKMQPAVDKGQPAGLLFDETNTHPKGASFRSSFLNVVSSLAVNDINTFNSNGLSDTFSAGDGDQQHATKSNYTANFANSPNFSASIQQKLTSISSTLTPQNIVDREMAMSCAGCHQLSNGKSLGGNLVWPSSLGFVHVSEAQRETSPEGLQRFKISPALTDVFLPRRKAVLETFLNGQ